MRSITNQAASMDGYFATVPVLPDLRLMPVSLAVTRLLTAPGWVALRPAALATLRTGMGAVVGAGFGAVSGHVAFWLVGGGVLGAALNAARKKKDLLF